MKLAIGLALGLLLAAGGARAADWSGTFGAVTDTVLFFGGDGTLWRAPFHQATRETLWTPFAGDRLVRVSVSPDGRSVAWLTRADEQDTTRLWIATADGVRPPLRFFSLRAAAFGVLHFEAGVPSLQDAEWRGGRFIAPGTLMRRMSNNTLTWTPDAKAVVFGYDDGLALAPAGGGPATQISPVLAVDLRLLDPAPLYLVDALVLREVDRDMATGSGSRGGPGSQITDATGNPVGGPGMQVRENRTRDVARAARPTRGAYLIYPMPGRWRFFPASGLDLTRPRVADETTVWWGEGRRIRAVRMHDPTPTTEVEAGAGVNWVGLEPGSRRLLWVAGNALHGRPQEGGKSEELLRVGERAREVLASAQGNAIAVFGGTLGVRDHRSGRTAVVQTGGRKPVGLFEAASGKLFVAFEGRGDGGPGLARVDFEGARLEEIETPDVKQGRFLQAPGGRHLLLFEPGETAPQRLHVLDVEAGAWVEVENPGITGWEPLEPL